MAGTKIGGSRAAATNKRKYGKNFYAKIGALGGAVGKTGGFYQDRELARQAGAKGGKLSRRGYKYLGTDHTGLPIWMKEN